ncbi:MAG: response regulator transcription factor [Oscillospiraceae bacterium]
MDYTILLAEDQKKLRDVVRDYFAAHGVACDLARDGAEALDLLRDHDYDAVLLDVLMPNLDGFAVCRLIREKSGVPVIFLTALGDEGSTLRGYELGADDYVAKPFSLAVLLAKTMALIKRGRGGDSGGALTCGAITLHPGSRTVTAAGETVPLTKRGYDLLECLLRNKGRVMSRADLLDKVWGLDFEGDDRAVDAQIKTLRAALGSAGKQIKTVFKAGYKLTEEG